jgi:hypothetical protein
MDLFDPSGKYISSVCYVESYLSQADALMTCKSYGYTLFTMTSADEIDAFNAFSRQTFGAMTSYTWVMWISGSLIGSDWIDSNDGSTPLPAVSLPTDTSQEGECLRISTEMSNAQWGVETCMCSKSTDFVCKFINPKYAT